MKENYLGIEIDYLRDSLLPKQGFTLLTKKGFYKKDHETSPQQSFARTATCYCFGDYGLAQRIYDHVSQKDFTFASPVLSNAVEINWPIFGDDQFQEASDWLERNVTPDGMPISCFLSQITDTKESLVKTRAETAWLSMMGGGIGIFAGNRSPDEKSTGVMAHLRGYDADALSYKQGRTRRGSIAAYMDINHPEILTFLDMRNPIGGDVNKKCFNLNNGVNITDEFMEDVIAGRDYELVDPKYGSTGRKISAREVWEKICNMRYETGEPYIEFIDTVNNNLPHWITNKDYKVKQSNLCNEIQLMTSPKRTAVCCLSSSNLDRYDYWKETRMVEDLIKFLDNVLEYFIRLAPPVLKRAVYSAKKERAVGLGTLGLHSYLQRKSIAFESGGVNSASQLCHTIYKDIKSRFMSASRDLASTRGEPDDLRGSGMRNSHGIAIAPNASSSSLICVSPSIEPWAANAITAGGRAGEFLIKNPHLESLLNTYGKNTPEVWSTIINDSGSVQSLEFLTEHEKLVYKTSTEIDMRYVVELASIRQPHICQGQSINIFLLPNTTAQEMSDLTMHAWKRGLKGLYYCRTESPVRASVGNGSSAPLNNVPVATEYTSKFSECVSCEG